MIAIIFLIISEFGVDEIMIIIIIIIITIILEAVVVIIDKSFSFRVNLDFGIFINLCF